MLSLVLVHALVAAPVPFQSILSEPSIGGQYLSARAVGMGGAQRGVANGIDAIFLNPAGMATSRHYVIEAGYMWGQAHDAHRPSVAVLDSETTQVAAGLAYGYDKRKKTGDLDVHRLHFGLAYAAGMFSIGATLKYQSGIRRNLPLLEEQLAETGAVLDPAAVRRFDAFTLDAAVMLSPIPQLSLAVIGYNLIPKGPVGKEGRELAPVALGIGAAVHVVGLELAMDAVVDFLSLKAAESRFHFGAEYPIIGMVPVRAGFIVDRLGRDNFWSLGTGFWHSTFGIDAAFRQAVANPANRYVAVTVRFNLH